MIGRSSIPKTADRRIAYDYSVRRCVVLAGLSLVGLCSSAQAATYTVGTTTDTSTIACSSDPCSLRGLIAQVHAHPSPPDVIDVPAGTYVLNPGLGALLVDHDISIVGAGADKTTIEMPTPVDRTTAGERVFDVGPPTGGLTPTVVLSGLEVTGGTANNVNGDFGGDIRSTSTLTLTDDWITGGFACSGGGVANVEATLLVERTLVSGNSAGCGGGDSGGIVNFGSPAGGSEPDLPGHLVVDDSTISGNDARLAGGIFSWNDATNTLAITNSTIAENSNKDEGGGAAKAQDSGSAAGALFCRTRSSRTTSR